MVFYANTTQEITEQEARHYEEGRRIAAAGMVLLENNGVLPLRPATEIALYGAGARHTIHGGLGAASVQARFVVTVEQGLEDAGYTVTTKNYLDKFDAREKAASDSYYGKLKEIQPPILAVVTMYANPYFMPDMAVEEEDIPSNRQVAVYVVARNSGEGADRKPVRGDYYLSESEEEDLSTLARHFQDIVVVLNVGAAMDTSFVREIPHISAVLVMNQPGNLAGYAVADVLSGKVNPEGKLASTWAKRLEDYPSSVDFLLPEKKRDDTDYTDGLYVGYRYFDSFRVEPAYPFGFGLSYTQFSIDAAATKVECRGHLLNFMVPVTNTGALPGREVVQLYVSAPQGKMPKVYQELKGFGKTGLLQPGESTVVTVQLELTSLACYDPEQAAWVLEPGRYVFRVGNSSRSTHVAAVWNLGREVKTAQCKRLFTRGDRVREMEEPVFSTDFYPGESQEINGAQAIVVDLEKIPCVTYSYQVEKLVYETKERGIIPFGDVVSGKRSLEEFIGQLSIREMATLCVGSDAERAPSKQENRADTAFVMESTPGASTGTTSRLAEKYGVPKVTTADGGGGLRVAPVFEVDPTGKVLTDGVASIVGMEKVLELSGRGDTTKYYQYTTSLPIPTMIAQTWDTHLMRLAGRVIGEEMEWLHLGIWLAPSMNLHRNPLCGRNFEYYSEDPFVTGTASAWVTRGVQAKPGYSVTIKHLACNNQEDNRNTISANVRERTLRELYLKGYEIAIRQAQPHCIMTSYNLINGTHTANLTELLTDAVRCEFGFRGMIMTDWGTTGRRREGEETKYRPSSAPGCIRAGNDLVMPGSPEDVEAIRAAAEKGDLSLGELQWCVRHILERIAHSHWFANDCKNK